MRKKYMPAIYIMANQRNGTLYAGVKNYLLRRIYHHKDAEAESLTKRYGCKLLVYDELHGDMLSAIAREKQIKGGSRKMKLSMIEKMNPDWKDLYEDLL